MNFNQLHQESKENHNKLAPATPSLNQEQRKKYIFSSDWFDQHIPYWKRILHGLEKQKINVLEIGSFEGRLLPDIDSEKNFLDNLKKTGKENQVEIIKKDGIMIFDDYDSDLYKEEFFNTKIAVDSFLRCYKQHIKVIEKYYQMAIRKVKPTTTFEMIVNV
ncbi:5519_t:CDS:2 [Entrophospora sp. SA101]|nr:5519_t:CDS:2 [Entrophospora sp. SA101]